MGYDELILDLEGKDQPIQEVADAPAQEDDDRDPMGTWRILDNPGKINLKTSGRGASSNQDCFVAFVWETFTFRTNCHFRGCRRFNQHHNWPR